MQVTEQVALAASPEMRAIYLELEPDNITARHLYFSFGFQLEAPGTDAHTMRYDVCHAGGPMTLRAGGLAQGMIRS